MKQLLKLGEMLQYLPSAVKDAVHHVAKDSGQKTDDLELHRHSHSEKAAVNGLDPKSRRALKYVSYRTQDRDDEIVIPETINLTEFKKYGHVLVNHNYSLLPVGSDVDISADDYGIKALTEYADTGAGTLANVVWALVSQGHLKSSSIGFVPTSFTKPGSRDWDHVANQLQSNWKEFDKARAEKSISRIITGGVLLEHSDVSVPCNADAELISVCKSMHMDGKVAKQLGWEMKDGILVNKAEAEPEKCVCDECGYVKTVVPGSKCPECKTGDMKPKAKEKAIVVISKGGEGSGNFGHEGRPGEVGGSGAGGGSSLPEKMTEPHLSIQQTSGGSRKAGIYIESQYNHTFSRMSNPVEVARDIRSKNSLPSGWQWDDNEGKGLTASIRVADEQGSLLQPDYKEQLVSLLKKAGEDQMAQHFESKSFHSHAVEKPNPHMPGGSFSACVLIMEDKGHDTESAKKICGALQADAGGKGLTQAETKAVREVTGKALPLPCTCHECGAEAACAPGSTCQEPDCEGTMVADKGRKGGPGSGNFGHSGRPGEVGGSGAGGGGSEGGKTKPVRLTNNPELSNWLHSFTNTAPGTAAYIIPGSHKPPHAIVHPQGEGSSSSFYQATTAAGELWVRENKPPQMNPGPLTYSSTEYGEMSRRMEEARGKKSFSPEIKVVRPAPSVKVLFVPPSGSEIAQRVGEAVEKALSRRTGKIL